MGSLRPSGSSARLVTLAARIIPVAERARYREEFEAELLVTAGRLRRLGFAVRVLVLVLPLRWELRGRAR